MRRVFGTIVLVVATLFCLLTTWQSGTAPVQFARALGLTVADAGGLNEIRAQYAGFFLFAAALCFAALVWKTLRQTAFTMLIVIFGGLFAGRLVSLGLDGGFSGYDPLIRSLYYIDAFGLAIAVAALKLDRLGVK
jgi:Domain of unknown function (DUF4345)